MGSILQVLVGGICVGSGHEPLFYTKTVVKHLGYWSKTVSGAGCIRHGLITIGNIAVVHTKHNSFINFVFCGNSKNNFFCTGCDVVLIAALGAGGCAEYTG